MNFHKIYKTGQSILMSFKDNSRQERLTPDTVVQRGGLSSLFTIVPLSENVKNRKKRKVIVITKYINIQE